MSHYLDSDIWHLPISVIVNCDHCRVPESGSDTCVSPQVENTSREIDWSILHLSSEQPHDKLGYT